MDICFLSSMHPPQDKRVFDKEARSLATAGFNVTHIAPGEGPSVSIDGVQLDVYPAPKGLTGRLKQLLSLYKRAKSIDADCYHCNEVDSWIVGVCLKLFRGKKVVFDVHEHYPSVFGEQRLPTILRPLSATMIRLLFRILTPVTDHIVLAKRTVASDFPQPRKHILVQNFTPLAALQERKTVDRSTRIANRLTAIHLGLFSKVRGWPQLLDALEQTPDIDVNVRLIGTVNDGTAEEFQQRLEDAALTERVEMTDWLPFDEAFEQVLESDIGLVLFQPGIQNHVFAMPHKMFDYMLAGLPVIAPAFAEEVSQIILEADCGILVDTANPDEIAAALRQLAKDPELLRRLGENGKQAVITKFNWENEAARLIEMYKNMEIQLDLHATENLPQSSNHSRAA